MALYPGTETEPRMPMPALLRLRTGIFQACRMLRGDAALLAENPVMADVRGVRSHGVLRVPDSVDKLLVGGVDPQGRPRVVQETAGAIVVDGGNSMGQIGSAFAMRRVGGDGSALPGA